MSEPTPTPSGPDDAQLGAVTEQELDNLLSHAATLAADASQQVGAPDSPPGAPPPPSPAELSATLDDELSRLEGLVASAASEVGTEAASPDTEDRGGGGASPKAAKTTTPEPNRGVPDFMMEFTEPASEAPSKPKAAAEAPPARTPLPDAKASQLDTPATASASSTRTATATVAAKPGIVGTGMLGVVITSKPDPELVTARGTAKEGGEGGVAAGSPASKGGIAKLLLPAETLVVRVLDLLDRPFARLGDGTKDIIGWIALATLGTALVVYLIRVI